MNLPDRVGRWALSGALLVWFGAWAGRSFGLIPVIGALVLLTLLALFRFRMGAALTIFVLAGSVSGFLSSERDLAVRSATIPEGVVELTGTIREDPRPGISGYWFIIDPEYLSTRGNEAAWPGPRLLVSTDWEPQIMAGQQISVIGKLSAAAGMARGDPYAGSLVARSIDRIGNADGFFLVANLLRSRVDGRLAEIANRPAAALVSGFLIGDVRELPRSDEEALRRAGLSHYVAVSGSNVALFLTLWWVVVAPFGFGPRRRAILGFIGLALFIVVTRWEPSVLRASVMAGFLLGARALGLSIGPWTALGGGVASLLLVSGELVADVGFQLSIAATAGVIAGSGYRPLTRFPIVGAALAATASAQLAVAPLLLVHFGTLPVFAPLTNLAAGPLVAASTTLGGVGVLTGIELLIGPATWLAAAVLGIARAASPWPQVGWIGYCGVMAAIGLGRVSGLRRPMALLTAACVFVAIGLQPSPVRLPAVVFLDVGQGDSTLLLSDDGAVVLIDGGPDPGILIERLRHYRVDHIDLLVASHQHHDHVAGLIAALEHLPVGRIWHSGHRDPEDDMRQFLESAELRNIPTEVVQPGWTAQIGVFHLDVKGPIRRYASPNDQSVVLLVEVGGQTILMSGDVEVHAQSDLGPIQAEVLKVPHQGAATSDLEWIRATNARLAVIPVGPNDYGHPSPAVLQVLEEMGAEVRRTDADGDIVLLVGG